MEKTWTKYREAVFGVDEDWIRANIIRYAIDSDPTITPWDDWRITRDRNGALQAWVKRT